MALVKPDTQKVESHKRSMTWHDLSHQARGLGALFGYLALRFFQLRTARLTNC
jgi:hypothetical protein